MSEMVLLHCGLNDFTTGPMPLRTAAAYIVEAVEDGMDCVGTHSVLAVEPQTVPVDFEVPFPYVPELEEGMTWNGRAAYLADRALAWDEGWTACASFAEGAVNPYRSSADIAEVKAQQTEEDLIELRRLGLA